MYNCILKLFLTGSHQSMYIKHRRKTLIEIGMHDLWLSHDVSNINFKWFKLQVKERLKKLFLQEWYSRIDNDNIYSNYKMLKPEFGRNPYLIKLHQ